jgi:hypothetical protein
MIKFDKNEFLKPQIYSTLDEYETRCNVTEEIIKEIEQLKQENKQLKDNWNKLKKAAKNHSDIKKKCYNGGLWFEIDDLLNKMIELEQGSDSNE